MEIDPEIEKVLKPDSVRGIEIDQNLKERVVSALRANRSVNTDGIVVRVEDRQVYLEGSVCHREQRDSAQKCITDIFGIRTVINYLTYESDKS
jgi:osmotically-inducible protein OsmY